MDYFFKAITHKTAKAMNIWLAGQFQPSKHCTLDKACKTAVNEAPDKYAAVKGEHLFINISSLAVKSLGGRKLWILVIDDCKDYSWSFFLKEESKLREKIHCLIKELQAKYICKVKYICCDNAGENTALEKMCKKEGLGITFQYIAQGVLQQNG